MNASRMASKLLPIGKIPHNIPSIAVGMASDGIGRAGGMSSRDQTVIEPEWTYLHDHRSYWLNMVGRLQPGETPQQAMADVNPLWVSLRTAEFPLVHDQSARSRDAYVTQTRLNLDSGAKGFSPYRDSLRTPLLVIMSMVLLVMAIAGNSPWFVAFVAVLGFFLFAVRAVLQAWLLDATPPDMGGSSIGLLFAIQALGSASGPFIGGLIADRYGIMMVFYFLAATIVVANMFIFITPVPVQRFAPSSDSELE